MPNKRKLRRFLSFTLLLYFMLSLMLFICETADARAGGGHGYSSGSGGGGGVGGAEGLALARLIFNLARLCIANPKLGIPVTAVVLAILYFVYKKGDNYIIDNTIKKATALYPSVSGQANLRKIKIKDPQFSEEGFNARATKAFKIVQECWCKGDLSKAEMFLADGTYEQFLLQLKVMKEKHITDVMENLSVTSCSILGFESDGKFDAIHLSITASAKNYRADSRTKKFIEGNRKNEEFTEVWTFLRRTGAKTLNKMGLIEGFCPNCGTPISMGRNAKCTSCGSILRSGEHDWVLAKITQACEWTAKTNKEIPGVKRYMAKDAGFSVQHIEDRLSVMFWRKNEAERLGNANVMKKVASDEYCEAQTKWYKPDLNGNRKFYSEAAVGAIQLICVDSDTSEKDDYIFAKVIWSGIPSKRFSSGKIESVANKMNFKDVFILKRKRGVVTNSKNSLSSGHCPSCGAPESDNLANECEYCGSVLNDGSKDWVLEAVVTPFDSAITRAVTFVTSTDLQANNQPTTGEARDGHGYGYSETKKTYEATDYQNSMNSISATVLLKWTIAMMLADGVIDESEKLIIYGLGQKRGLNQEKIDSMINEISLEKNPVGYVDGSTDLPVNADLMRILIRIAYADGKITKEEIELIRYVAKKMSMSTEEVRKLLTEERMVLYRMSKAVVKESKIK